MKRVPHRHARGPVLPNDLLRLLQFRLVGVVVSPTLLFTWKEILLPVFLLISHWKALLHMLASSSGTLP